ncbi:MAG: hypothetical protein LCH85_09565 [Chloroflexi bacterium]|nr:hypothetical protein [Chloroflexota bacterium]
MRIIAIISLDSNKSQKIMSSQVFRELAGKPIITHCIETLYTLNDIELILITGLTNIPIELTNRKKVEFIQDGADKIRIGAFDNYDAILLINGFFPLLSEKTIKLLINSILHKKLVYIDTTKLNPLNNQQWNSSKIMLINRLFPYGETYDLENIFDSTNIYSSDVNNEYITSIDPIDKSEIVEVVDNETWSSTYAKIREIINRKHMLNGITIVEPTTTYIDIDVVIGLDTTIYPGTIISGPTKIGNNCIIGPKAVIHNSKIESDCIIRSAVIEDCYISRKSIIDSNIHLNGQSITPDSQFF